MNVMILIKEQGVKIMKRNEFKALLAVSVIAVPLVFATGCGKKTDNTAVEPTVQAEITATIEEQAETIEESVAESIHDITFEEPGEPLDESELYTEDNNEDIIVEETESAEQTDSDVVVVDGRTYEDGLCYDEGEGILYVSDGKEVMTITKAEIESWGMTVDEYLSYFKNPSGGSSHSQEGLSDGEFVDPIEWGSGNGAVGGHIQ